MFHIYVETLTQPWKKQQSCWRIKSHRRSMKYFLHGGEEAASIHPSISVEFMHWLCMLYKSMQCCVFFSISKHRRTNREQEDVDKIMVCGSPHFWVCLPTCSLLQNKPCKICKIWLEILCSMEDFFFLFYSGSSEKRKRSREKENLWSKVTEERGIGERRSEAKQGRVWVRKTLKHSKLPVLTHKPALHSW